MPRNQKHHKTDPSDFHRRSKSPVKKLRIYKPDCLVNYCRPCSSPKLHLSNHGLRHEREQRWPLLPHRLPPEPWWNKPKRKLAACLRQFGWNRTSPVPGQRTVLPVHPRSRYTCPSLRAYQRESLWGIAVRQTDRRKDNSRIQYRFPC